MVRGQLVPFVPQSRVEELLGQNGELISQLQWVREEHRKNIDLIVQLAGKKTPKIYARRRLHWVLRLLGRTGMVKFPMK
jgi:hypothetical protein